MCRSIVTISLILLMFGGVIAGTIKVPDDYAKIQAGINAASNGDTVLVADGIYYENINFKGKAVTVASYFFIDGDTIHIDNTIIDGSQPSHPDTGSVVLFISGEDTASVLYGFTITNGSGSVIAERRRGGGICIFNSGARISDNKIINNMSVSDIRVYGGGISAGDPENNSCYIIIDRNLVANNMAISNNEYPYGGGIDIRMANFRVVENKISYNLVSGFRNCYAPSVRLCYAAANSVFRGNTISFNYYGSGECAGGMLLVYVPNGFIVEKNYFRGNTGGNGGALLISDSSPIVRNNIFFENSGNRGGAIGIGASTVLTHMPQIINNTILSNTALEGGGLYVNTPTTQNLVMNTILWENSASTGAQIFVANGTLDVVYSDVQGGCPGEGNIDLDPAFEPGDHFYHLSTSSPCINKGISTMLIAGAICCCPGNDFDGDTRPYSDSKPDIGADETNIPTRIDMQPAAIIPEKYALEQNYPNPFNPSTTIEFALPQSSFVTLKIYNILGKEVASLVSEMLAVGNYNYHWNATRMAAAAGVYFYQLRTDKFSQTKKMILMP